MALIPPFFLDCVVAIGKRQPDDTPEWFGSGFLVGRRNIEEEGNKYHVYLVTNRRFLIDEAEITVRLNTQDEDDTKDYLIPLYENYNQVWLGHSDSNIDVAAILINTSVLIDNGTKFAYFYNDQHIAKLEEMGALGISEGDFVYVMGFPQGIEDKFCQNAIVRSGTISRIRDVIKNKKSRYLVDTNIVPGNSGGPVVNKPELIGTEGTKSPQTANLIGIISGYIPYEDISISRQTKRPKVIIEENSGLVTVIPADFIIETIEALHTARFSRKSMSNVHQDTGMNGWRVFDSKR